MKTLLLALGEKKLENSIMAQKLNDGGAYFRTPSCYDTAFLLVNAFLNTVFTGQEQNKTKAGETNLPPIL